MKKAPVLLAVLLLPVSAGLVAQKEISSARPDYAIEPVPLSRVEVTDVFWAPRMETNQRVSIWHCFQKFHETSDFDSPKLIEAAAYMLTKGRDPALEAHVDAQIEALVAATVPRAADPDKAIRVSGHFYEAAVAYFEATGKRRMLDAAVKLADTIAASFGPGKKTYISSHEGLKIGLLRLYRLTGDDKYLRVAKFFLDERGREDYPRQGEYALDRTYAQDHKPVVAQDEAVGHAVRAMFLYIPMTDMAALTGDIRYDQALDKIWTDMVTKKAYITGGIGSVRFHEQFGAPYELPNLSAWNETCAAYGNVVWNQRMFLHHGDAKYLDFMERVLYNGLLVGVSQKGDRFFYQNPLMSYGDYERFDWINVPCCPPNVVRLIASIGSYIYAQGDTSVYVNLFVGSKADLKVGTAAVKIQQETRYPWEGTSRIRVTPERPIRFALNVRIPGWVGNDLWPGRLYETLAGGAGAPRLTLNGRMLALRTEKGFARIEREWHAGDTLELSLPMPVRRIIADRRAQDNVGRVALQRGLLVYCVEWPDNGGHALNIVVADDAKLQSEFRPELLGGVQVLTGRVKALRRAADGISIETRPHDLVAIPYFAWANRGMGEMAVWLARREHEAWVRPVPPDPIANVSAGGAIEKKWTGYNDQNDDVSAIYDGVDPLHSADESHRYLRLRPAEGQPAWIEYTFKRSTTVSSAEIYWVDDRRFCHPPASWRILYRVGDRWEPVKSKGPYGVDKDRFDAVAFEPVITTAVRLEVEPKAISYKAGQIGPPDAFFLNKDVVWRECGIIEFRIR